MQTLQYGVNLSYRTNPIEDVQVCRRCRAKPGDLTGRAILRRAVADRLEVPFGVRPYHRNSQFRIHSIGVWLDGRNAPTEDTLATLQIAQQNRHLVLLSRGVQFDRLDPDALFLAKSQTSVKFVALQQDSA